MGGFCSLLKASASKACTAGPAFKACTAGAVFTAGLVASSCSKLVEFATKARQWVGRGSLYVIRFFARRSIPETIENATRFCPISVMLAKEDIGLAWILDRIEAYIRNPLDEDWKNIETNLKERGCGNIATAFMHVSCL